MAVFDAKEVTSKLESGVKELFESERYLEYLKTMSRFHNYSARNITLIHLQMPNATRVAGFNAWKKLERHPKRGEHGIKIFAPISFKISEEKEKLDPETHLPVLGADGLPVIEVSERTAARFKVVSVFDVSQTDGEPLPSLAETLIGDVERYDLMMDALRAVSPLPIVFEDMPSDMDGVCHYGDRIAIRQGMSEVQTVSAVIHEITHAKLHDAALLAEGESPKDRRAEEIEAESVSYVVCQHFGVETGANSFGYLAEWSRGRDLKEMNASLDTIRKAAAELIDGVDAQYRTLAKERAVDLTAPTPQAESNEQTVMAHTANDNFHFYGKEAELVAEKLGLPLDQEHGEIEGVPYDAFLRIPKDKLDEYAERLLTFNISTGVDGVPKSMLDMEKQVDEFISGRDALIAEYARAKNDYTIGQNVLLTPVFDDGNYNRSGKKIRVTVEPPIGKYQIFSRDENDEKRLYFLTASGYVNRISDYFRDEWDDEQSKYMSYRPTEAELDEAIGKIADRFEKNMADPTQWAMYQDAAVVNRLDDCEAHNVPVRKLREDERRQEREKAELAQQEQERQEQETYDARVDEIATSIKSGKTISVAYDEYAYDGKNPVLDLFKLYGVELPLRTQGWVNTGLAEITDGSYRYYKSKHKGDSTAFGGYLRQLREAIQATPIEQKRLELGGDKPSAEEPQDDIQQTLDAFAEKHGFGKLTAEFYNELHTKREPQNVIIREGEEGHELLRRNLFAFSNGDKPTGAHLAEYFTQLETTKAVTVVGHDDLTVYDIDAIKVRRDYQVRERQNKLGRDMDLPLPAAKWCGVGDTVLIYNPEMRRCSYMKIAVVEKKSVVLQDISNSYYKVKLSLDRFKNEQGFDFAEDKAINAEVKKTKAHNLYEKFGEMFPEFLAGKYNHMKLESVGFEPLSLEWIGGSTISVMHTYTMNGDLMYDPMITFKVDNEAKTLTATSFEQSMPTLYQEIDENGDGESIDGNGNQRTIKGLRGQVETFADGWFDNIKSQDFHPAIIDVVVDEDNSRRVYYNADGKAFDIGMGHLGNGLTVWNRLEEKNGDYVTVAHIAPDRKVSFRADDLPEAAKQYIERTARTYDMTVSVSQKAKVFDAPPQVDEPTISAPDPSVTAEQLAAYGYTQPDMLPLGRERALELFANDLTIYILFSDNTEMLALETDDIHSYSANNMLGITKADWLTHLEREKTTESVKASEGSREADLLYGEPGRFGIYQIPDGVDEKRDFRFASMKELEAHGLSIDRDNYALVYTGKLDIHDRMTNLNRLFKEFQHDDPNCPQDFTGRSASISDVIVLQWRGEVSAHYVDRVGFAELPLFTGNEREKPQAEQAAPTLSQVGIRETAKRPPIAKGKPSLLARLEESNKLAAHGGKSAPAKSGELEV